MKFSSSETSYIMHHIKSFWTDVVAAFEISFVFRQPPWSQEDNY